MQITNYDSEFCGKLPIHLTNLIQPYGALLVLDKIDGKIIQASENISIVLGKPAADLIGKDFMTFLPADLGESIKTKFKSDFKDKIPVILKINDNDLLSIVHRKPGYVLIEIELEPITFDKRETFIDVYQDLKFVMARIESSSSVQEACDIAAAELKRISGFDKVMIYRFDEHWNGTVLTEVKEKRMESYLGVTFPASDIPRQARELYLRNPYRFIPDRDYKPVKLYPVVNPVTNSFIDLSDCNLRSVVAVHIEYLKNMGVSSSMSTRILMNEKLWGLIACHHRTAKYLNYEMCSVFEMLSSIISVKITSLQNKEEHQFESFLSEGYAQLIERIYKARDLDELLISEDGPIKLFGASGVMLSRKGKITAAGKVPSDQFMDELILWLHTRQLKKVFYTNSLPELYDEARDFVKEASGLLVIPLDVQLDEYLIFVRPEIEKVINWGGDPEERIVFEKDQKNYHPRSSFKQWQQIVRGNALPWMSEEVKTAEMLRSFLYEYETSTP